MMTKFLAACLALFLSSFSASADTLDVFDFSFHTSDADPFITHLGYGSRSVTGRFYGSDGVLTGFSGSFTAPQGGWALNFPQSRFSELSGTYSTTTGALTSLLFRFFTEQGEFGSYTYWFGGGNGDPGRDLFMYEKSGGSGPQRTQVTASWTPVPEMDGAGLASALFVFLAALARLAQRRRDGSVRTGGFA